jgi:hypothetical protein
MTVRYGTRVAARLGSDASWGALEVAGLSAGVRLVVSLPIQIEGAVAGTLTLYADDTRVLDRQLRRVFARHRKSVVDAVSNAAAPLEHRLATALRPEPVRDQNAIDWAISLIAAHLDTDAAVASDLFRRAATRSGLADSDLAQHLAGWLTPSRLHSSRATPGDTSLDSDHSNALSCLVSAS